jgi:hypothetical protein
MRTKSAIKIAILGLSVAHIVKVLLVTLLIGVMVYLLYTLQPMEVGAGGPPPTSFSSPVVVVRNGEHGSIWKFHDGNRECYFNSAGGIWCER